MYIKKVTTYKRGEHEQSTDGWRNDHSRGRNVLVAKRLGGETSRWRNVQGAKRPVKGRNVRKPTILLRGARLHNVYGGKNILNFSIILNKY